MPSKSDSVEGTVLNFLIEENRPFNAQIIADMLQKYGIKKSSVQKALDTLADSGKVLFKEYGKQKIYLAKQDQFAIPNKEELDDMKKNVIQLQEDVKQERKTVNGLEGEIVTMESNMTLDQINTRMKHITDEMSVMAKKVEKLRGGSVLVTTEERQKIESSYDTKIASWRKRKRMFKELWDMITEGMPKNPKDIKEEVGIETDEDVGINFQEYCNHTAKRPKR